VARVIVLDASVMIAVLDPLDAHFEAARRLFLGTTSERLAAHRLTVAESLVLATRAEHGPAAASALAALGVGYVDEPDDPLALAELRATTGLRMPDCCVLHVALREKARLATFDAQLAGVASRFGVEVVTTG
jgi:predicted nucleic acid-binding protein